MRYCPVDQSQFFYKPIRLRYITRYTITFTTVTMYMTISSNDLTNITKLAYLENDPNNSAQLATEIGSIMDFVEQITNIDTSGIAPLFHPMDLHQRLRADSITEADCLEELANIAPLFDDDLYLVPKIIDTGK